MGERCAENNAAIFEAMRRGEDYTRHATGVYIEPRPPMVGNLTTFAALTENVLHSPSATPAPNQLAGVGQYPQLRKIGG